MDKTAEHPFFIEILFLRTVLLYQGEKYFTKKFLKAYYGIVVFKCIQNPNTKALLIMKTIYIEKAGGYDQLKFKEIPTPKPGKGEILIENKACGINFADCCVRMGLYKSATEFVGWPITPGFETSGIIAEVGEGVQNFSKGQKVIAFTLFNGYAPHLVVPEDQVFLLPDHLDFAHGAALPTIFLTAYYALYELAHIKKKDLILVHSAAGGVGSALVQLALQAECQVIGVVGSSHKVDYVKHLGAHAVIDKSTQNLWKEAEKWAPEGYDVILDANGAESLRHDYHHLSPGGKLVVYGFHSMFSKGRGKPNWFKMLWHYLKTPRFNPFCMTSDNHSILAFNLSFMFKKKNILKDDFQILLKWIQERKLVLPHIKTYPFERVADAHRDLESGQTLGKLVLTLD